MDDLRRNELATMGGNHLRADAPGSNPKSQKARSIEVDEDMAWQRRTWTAKRIGWWGMGAIALAALIGVFGHGPVSWQQASEPAGLVRVEYERFERQLSEHTLKIDIAPGAATGGDVALRLSEAFLDAAAVKEIAPRPREERSAGHDVEYVFSAARLNQPATVRFVLKLKEAGIIQAEVGLAGREPARFTQFV